MCSEEQHCTSCYNLRFVGYSRSSFISHQTDDVIMKHIDALDMCLRGNQLNTPLCPVNEYHSTQISQFVLQRLTGNLRVDKSDLDKFAAKVILDTFLEFLKEV